MLWRGTARPGGLDGGCFTLCLWPGLSDEVAADVQGPETMSLKKKIFMDLMADMAIRLDRQDEEEASARVVIIEDPETDKYWVKGPFPKDGIEAMAWMEKFQVEWKKAGSPDPPVRLRLAWLGSPEEFK